MITNGATLVKVRQSDIINGVLEIPDYVETIESLIFDREYDTHCLVNKVILPKNLKVIENSAFFDCCYLKEVIFNDEIEVIGDYAFQYCKLLKEIILPDSVCVISYGAFENCSSLKSIRLPEGNDCKISKKAFAFCGIEDITIPGGVKTINAGVFYSCEKLKNVKLQNGVKVIGEFAFNGCIRLQNVSYPETLSAVFPDAFPENHRFTVSYPENINRSIPKLMIRQYPNVVLSAKPYRNPIFALDDY